MLFRRVNKSSASADLKSANSLAAGAQTIYDMAKKERWPLAYIAERSGRPVYWFAENVLRVVDVYGHRPDEADYVRLTREVVSGLTLTDDMSALVAADTAAPRYVDLRVTGAELARYINWARTVQ
jgi:hypothetical protein